jgi:hypothetical protein
VFTHHCQGPLRTSDQLSQMACFFADALMGMGLYPCCNADPDVWMTDCGTHHEFVCVRVDGLACVMKHTHFFFQELRCHRSELKGVGGYRSSWAILLQGS